MQPIASRESALLRFLVDENVPVEIGLKLESGGHDTLIVGRTALRGSADTLLWARAVKDQRIIVTRNHDFPLVGVTGKPAGIILLRPVDNKPSAVVRCFNEFWDSADPNLVVGSIVVVQPGRIRSRPL
jgi:predicted nuclease of predicted toxin-antitoxin system